MERQSFSARQNISADKISTGDFDAIMIGAGFVSKILIRSSYRLKKLTRAPGYVRYR